MVCKRNFRHSISLTKLLRKGVKFEWDDKCQLSFEQLKKILVEALVLTQPTSGREYVGPLSWPDPFLQIRTESGMPCYHSITQNHIFVEAISKLGKPINIYI